MNQNQSTHFPATLICGVDEVGRGCLAGPMLSVAALFRSWNTGCPDVDDSKKLSPKKREKLFRELLHSPDLLDFGVGEVAVEEIDKMGIDQANVLAFDRAVKALRTRPNFLVVDGLRGAPGWHHNEMLVTPQADGKYPVVGAASILAKVIRDSLMVELHSRHPVYAWNSNKGYGSPDHITALKSHGPTPHHRSLFIREIIQPQMELFR
jgi:ribonuclease HII